MSIANMFLKKTCANTAWGSGALKSFHPVAKASLNPSKHEFFDQ